MQAADFDLDYSRYSCWIQDEKILAFLSGHWIADQFMINQVYVHPSYRGQGLARQLLQRLEPSFQAEDGVGEAVGSLYLEVRESNQAARKLYQACNFKDLDRRKNYYTAPKEDAVIMVKKLEDSQEGHDEKRYSHLSD